MYGAWVYAEVNQQQSTGLEPGEGQMNVQLQDVQFVFSGLPSAVTEIVTAVKDRTDDKTDSYTEIGRYAVSNGAVTIPVAYHHLVSYFGLTHYSVWFKVLGGRNGQGIECGAGIEILGTINGQSVNLTKDVAFGTNPPPTPTPAATSAPACVSGAPLAGFCWHYGNLNESCVDVCAPHGGTTGGTITYAGATTANCDDAMEAVGAPGAAAVGPTGCGDPMGCLYNVSMTLRFVCSTVTQAGVNSDNQRVCSCVN